MKKDELPVPEVNQEQDPDPAKQLEDLKKRKQDLEEIKKQFDQADPDKNPEITNQDIISALKELYQLLSNRFDQIYFKIDQTQDLIIPSLRNKKE